MGLFDFLKRKELARIAELERQIDSLNIQIGVFAPITNVDKEIEIRQQQSLQKERQREAEFSKHILELNNEVKRIIQERKTEESKLEQLRTEYANSIDLLKRLRDQVDLFESKVDYIEYGLYQPVYDFEKSDDYRVEQDRILGFQKDMIKADTAAICKTTWTVGQSEASGRVMVKRVKKLMLRAFNGECDALVSKVKWNNIAQLRERMTKMFEAINKLGEHMDVSIANAYFSLKQKEMTLEYEFQTKRQQEKEEMRAIQEELREEEKAKREFEQAQRLAEKEALSYQKALEKARREVEDATGAKQIKLQAQIELLQQQLLEAQDQRQRALSMAQQTKRGHVYIISNVGSFGENVFKIGMTRRLEPTDRVKELGDASVPFQFDIHAMIYCDDAPNLENALHRAFTDRKVNMLNYRKEFFNVTLDEVEAKIAELGFQAEFTRLAEAMEYRETQAILEKLRNQVPNPSTDELIKLEFPLELPRTQLA